MPESLRLVGRTSSHFTRTARIFAEELSVPCSLELVPDLLSRDPQDYAGNPALRMPILETPEGRLFGTLNICRELARRAWTMQHVVWPEDHRAFLLANAQELVLQAMATEVTLIASQLGGALPDNRHTTKLYDSLANSLAWLEIQLADALDALPARDLSFFEVTLFCLVTHLRFREVVPLDPYPALHAFCESFAQRPSAIATPYAFQ